MFRQFLIAAALIITTAAPSLAHEYYLLPENFAPKAGSDVQVRHRLGQRFNGNEMPFIKKWNIRSERWQDGEMVPVDGLDGDRPALTVKDVQPGMTVIAHQSNIDKLTFKTWDKFKSYAYKEGLGYAVDATLASGKPKDSLREGYSRFAKTLIVTPGNTDAMDSPVGLKIELVALANPNALAENAPMPVQVLLDGNPLPGAMMKVFSGIDSEASHRILTDAEGKAPIPASGPGPYLLNAIHMSEPQSPGLTEDGVHWESFWASLTFARPN